MLSINDIVNTALNHAESIEHNQQVKLAEEQGAGPAFTSALAAQMHKIAEDLKNGEATKVTHADVKAFAKRIAG